MPFHSADEVGTFTPFEGQSYNGYGCESRREMALLFQMHVMSLKGRATDARDPRDTKHWQLLSFVQERDGADKLLPRRHFRTSLMRHWSGKVSVEGAAS